MSRLTRHGTAKSVSRNQILRREREQEIFPVQLTMDRIGKLTLNSRLLSGHLGFVTGTLRGSLFPVCYGSVGVQLTRLRKLNQGTLTSKCVRKKLDATILQVTSTREFF